MAADAVVDLVVEPSVAARVARTNERRSSDFRADRPSQFAGGGGDILDCALRFDLTVDNDNGIETTRV